MLYEVHVLHNTTTTREAADRGDDDCATLVRADERYAEQPAIFSRLSEPRARAGDRLRRVVGMLVVGEPGKPQSAAEAAYVAGNGGPFRSPARSAYVGAGVRSLSSGDVVVVRTSEKTLEAFGCEPFGWTPVDLSDFKVED